MNFVIILEIVGAIVGVIGGALAGRNLIYLKLTQTNLFGEEEEIDGAYEEKMELAKFFMYGATILFGIGFVCVMIGSGFSVDNQRSVLIKTGFLIIALICFGLGAYLASIGASKKH